MLAGARFIEWMQDEGYTGWWAAPHIDEFWGWYARDAGLSEISGALIREYLRDQSFVRYGRRRLNSPEFAHVKKALGRDRGHVYRIPGKDEIKSTWWIEAGLSPPGPDDVTVGVSLDRPASGPQATSKVKRPKKVKLTPREQSETRVIEEPYRRAA